MQLVWYVNVRWRWRILAYMQFLHEIKTKESSILAWTEEPQEHLQWICIRPETIDTQYHRTAKKNITHCPGALSRLATLERFLQVTWEQPFRMMSSEHYDYVLDAAGSGVTLWISNEPVPVNGVRRHCGTGNAIFRMRCKTDLLISVVI